MADSLAESLRERRVASLIADAAFIAAWPAGAERADLAEQHIREAMYLNTIGKLSQVEVSRLYSILSFAMPDQYYVEGE